MTMDAAEQARRDAQRARQQAALKRQAEGGLSKKEIKKRRAAGEPLPKIKKTRGDNKGAAASCGESKSLGTATRPTHDMVIVPIFWRNVEGQEESMVREAQRIKSLLHKRTGLDVWVDRTHKMTPGQKLNFWEQQGVRWRVEIGPKEAAKKRCVVSYQSGVAGDFTTVKKLTNVSTIKQSQLLSKLRNGLSLTKITEEHILEAANDPEGDSRQDDLAEENLKAMLRPKEAPTQTSPARNRNDNDGRDGDSATVPNDEERPATARGFKAEAETRADTLPQVDEKKLNAKERRALKRAQMQQAGDALDETADRDSVSGAYNGKKKNQL